MHKVLFPISADPIHFGHISILQKALNTKNCKIDIMISINDLKKDNYLFTLNERLEITKRVVNENFGSNKDLFNRINVFSSEKLLADEYLEGGYSYVLRGIRDEKDREYELQQARYHKMINYNMNFWLLEADYYENVSSSLIKSFVSHNIDVSKYVPLFIKQALEEKILGQYKLGITGGIAVGKSWLLNKFGDSFRKMYCLACADDGPQFHKKYQIKIIKIDELLRQLYDEQSDGANLVRQELVRLCGPESVVDNKVNTKYLSKFLFEEIEYSEHKEDIRYQLQQLTTPHIERLYRQSLNGFSGLVLLEWAQLAEMYMGHWVNNNVVVVDVNEENRKRNFFKRDISENDSRLKYQWNTQEKLQALKNQNDKDKHGNTLLYYNDSENDIPKLVKSVVDIFPQARFGYV